MKVLFSLHAGEYVFGEKIEALFPNAKLWVPAKDTGIDFLLTDSKNSKAVSFQVKFSKDFLSDSWPKDYQEQLLACGWWNLNSEKIRKSEADLWVFVLHSFFEKEFQYIIIKPEDLFSRLTIIHGEQKVWKVYFWVTKDKKAWEARGLKNSQTYQIIQKNFVDSQRDFSSNLNSFDFIKNSIS